MQVESELLHMKTTRQNRAVFLDGLISAAYC